MAEAKEQATKFLKKTQDIVVACDTFEAEYPGDVVFCRLYKARVLWIRGHVQLKFFAPEEPAWIHTLVLASSMYKSLGWFVPACGVFRDLKNGLVQHAAAYDAARNADMPSSNKLLMSANDAHEQMLKDVQRSFKLNPAQEACRVCLRASQQGAAAGVTPSQRSFCAAHLEQQLGECSKFRVEHHG